MRMKMGPEISNTVFEWLLAEWVGSGNNPVELFPSLRNVDRHDLTDELTAAIRKAGSRKGQREKPLAHVG